MASAVPDWYCRRFWLYQDTHHAWLNGQNRLNDWRRILVARYVDDGRPLQPRAASPRSLDNLTVAQRKQLKEYRDPNFKCRVIDVSKNEHFRTQINAGNR